MSDKVDFVRRCYELMNDRRLDAAEDFIAPGFQLDLSRRVLNPDTYDGAEGLGRFLAELEELWERVEFEPRAFEPIGECVVADVFTTLVGRVSGVEVTDTIFHVWTLEGGKASRLAVYTDREEAVGAARLG
jgi:ketosteroid isomerase-like protein